MQVDWVTRKILALLRRDLYCTVVLVNIWGLRLSVTQESWTKAFPSIVTRRKANLGFWIWKNAPLKKINWRLARQISHFHSTMTANYIKIVYIYKHETICWVGRYQVSHLANLESIKQSSFTCERLWYVLIFTPKIQETVCVCVCLAYIQLQL